VGAALHAPAAPQQRKEDQEDQDQAQHSTGSVAPVSAVGHVRSAPISRMSRPMIRMVWSGMANLRESENSPSYRKFPLHSPEPAYFPPFRMASRAQSRISAASRMPRSAHSMMMFATRRTIGSSRLATFRRKIPAFEWTGQPCGQQRAPPAGRRDGVRPN